MWDIIITDHMNVTMSAFFNKGSVNPKMAYLLTEIVLILHTDSIDCCTAQKILFVRQNHWT